MKKLLALAILLLSTTAFAADVPTPPKDAMQIDAAAPKTDKTISIDASEKPVGDVLKQISTLSGETILVEKLVSGKVTVGLKDTTIEKALDTITQTLGIQWRKIYVIQGSSLAKDADALASQMRTVLALRFPDIAISSEGSGGSFLHVQKASSANEIIKILPPTAAFKTVYLVTDDEKAAKKELKDAAKAKVAKYVEESKKLTQSFLDMSNEERMAVLKESMNMMNQLGPELMQEMLTSVIETDPDYISQMNQMNVKAIMSLSPETRKSLLRASMKQAMEAQMNPTPEMLQLQQEQAAIAQELAAEMNQNHQ